MRLALLTGSVTILWPSRKAFGLARSFVADFTIVQKRFGLLTTIFKRLLFLHNLFLCFATELLVSENFPQVYLSLVSMTKVLSPSN